MKNHIKSFLFKVVDWVTSLPFMDLNRIHLKVIEKLELKDNTFITEHARPKYSKSFGIQPQLSGYNEKIALVLQGPLVKDDNFTLETVLFYKANFKDAVIIVSTWSDEDANLINKIEATGAVILLNQKPAFAGISHINYQITSSINGILKARELGAQYVMKTRTDQRIYGLNVIGYFLNLIKLYPLKNLQVQKQRLIIPNINTFLFRIYGISDMLMFGNIDDMILYWNADHDQRLLKSEETLGLNIKEFSELRACEIYLSTEFLKKTGKKLHWTIEDSWHVFANNFCIVDYHSIDLFWPKYAPHQEFRNRYYNSNNTHQLITFGDWLSLYNSLYTPPNDKILNYHEGEDFRLNDTL
ncbi:MAG: WavE lipopolysaccharide synthesis family protein [Bacteroidota bacterium]